MSARRHSLTLRIFRKVILWDDGQTRDPLNWIETFLACWLLYFRALVLVCICIIVLVHGYYFVFHGEPPDTSGWLAETGIFLGFVAIISTLPATVVAVLNATAKSENRGRHNDLIIEESKIIDEDER